MRLPTFLRTRRSHVAELEALRAENAQLRYDLATALIASWIRRNPSPKALLPPDQKPASKRADPHPVQVGRHARAEPVTEFFPRRQR